GGLSHKPGRDAFHRVPNIASREKWGAMKRVPTMSQAYAPRQSQFSLAWLNLLILTLCLITLPAFAGAKTETRLILDSAATRPGDTVWGVVELKMPDGWHTYWRNGGESGTPTKIVWTLPPGVQAGELQWPPPRKTVTTIGDYSITTYDYDDTVGLVVPFALSKEVAPGSLELKGKVSWQECADLCIPGHSEITASLNIANEAKPSANAA